MRTILNEKYRILIHITVLFFLSCTISDSFINVFIYGQTKNATAVIVNNLSTYVTMIVFSLIYVRLKKRFRLEALFRFGILCFAFRYLLIMLLGEKIGAFVVLVGALQGTSCVFYYVPLNTFLLKYNEGNLDAQGKYFGTFSLVTGIVSMIVPGCAGFVAEKFGTIGYSALFLSTAIGLLLCYLLAIKMPPVEAESAGNVFGGIADCMRNKNVRSGVFAELLRGAFQGNFGTLIVLMFFMVTQSEFLIGLTGLPLSLCGILGSVLTIRFMSEQNSKRIVIFSTGLILLFSILCGIRPAALIIFVFWVFFQLLSNPCNSAMDLLVARALKSYPVEGYVCREVFINIGRIIGALIALPLSASLGHMAIGCCLLAAIQCISAFWYCKIRT